MGTGGGPGGGFGGFAGFGGFGGFDEVCTCHFTRLAFWSIWHFFFKYIILIETLSCVKSLIQNKNHPWLGAPEFIQVRTYILLMKCQLLGKYTLGRDDLALIFSSLG